MSTFTDLQLPSRLSSSPFERAPLALANLARFDAEATARSLLAPDTLSPKEKRTIADELGVGQGNSVYDFVIRSITNPVVLAGAILAIKYPIPTAKNLFQFSKKLVGLNKTVGPVMRTVGSIDEVFPGTPIPEAYKKLLRTVEEFRRTKADRMGVLLTKAEGKGFKFTRENEILLSAKLDGLDDTAIKGITPFKKINLGPAGEELYTGLRKEIKSLWQEVHGTMEKRYALVSRQLAKLPKKEAEKLRARLRSASDPAEVRAAMKAKLTQRRASAQGAVTRGVTNQMQAANFLDAGDENVFKLASGLKEQTKYFPHQVALTSKDFEEATKSLLTAGGGTRRALAERNLLAATLVSTGGSSLPKAGGMIPAIEDLALVKNHLKPGGFAQVLRQAEHIKETGHLAREYSLRFMPVMSSYLHASARAVGWTLTTDNKGVPLGEVLRRSTVELAKADPVRATMMKDSYIPLALGRTTFKQAMAASKWAQMKMNLLEGLDSKEWGKFVPASMKNWFKTTLSQDRGVFSLNNVSGRSVGYLYLSTLGLSPVSATYNLMQTILTTVPTIGPKHTMTGLKKVFEKVPEYFRARVRGVGHEGALAKSFPEFASEGLVAAPLTEETLSKTLNQAWEVSLSTGIQSNLGKKVDRVKGAMMAMFTGSESIVRLTAFEGALAKATAEGMALPEATTFARRVTEATQFLGGPANVPAVMREWNPLLRQLGSFPARMVGYLMGLGTMAGSGAQVGGLGRNFGTLGRTLLTSGLAYEGGQALLDRDLSHGLLFGAIPRPNPQGPFGVVPFVPPALAIGGSIASDVFTGEFNQTRFALPLMVPGGVGLSKMAGLFSPGLANAIGRGYADFDTPTEDGRIPMYTGRGAYRGNFSPMQVYMESLGLVGGAPYAQKEQELEGYLLQQRDRIRSYRRDFLDSIADNNMKRALEIRTEYEQTYPGLGSLTVKAQDLRAVHLRRFIPRVERMLDTLPVDAREQFGQLVAMTLAEETEGIMGVDPMLLQQRDTSILQREPWRHQRPGGVLEDLYMQQIRRKQIPHPATGPFGGGSQGGGSFGPLGFTSFTRPGGR